MMNNTSIFKTAFASLWAGILLMALYAMLCAVATFIENDYGANVARALVYDTWIFNLIHAWILVCLCGIIIRYKLFQQRKYASLLLHLSFIVIIIGAGITRFFGHEGMIHIREGESNSFYVSAENYINITLSSGDKRYDIHIPTNVNYVSSRNLNEKIVFGDDFFMLKSNNIQKLTNDKADSRAVMNGTIEYHGKEYAFSLIGGAGVSDDILVNIEDMNVFINWGAREIELPFELTLESFVVERYPGSIMPSSYQSNVVLFDKEKNIEMPYEIYMNHTLDYRQYRFFQSSYDQDEKGTILSINNDPGKIPTYIGYAMLILGSISILFARNSRFRKLGKYLRSQNIHSIALCVAMIGFLAYPLQAEQVDTHSAVENLELFKRHSKEHAKVFGELQVQDYNGRTKPLDTLAADLVHKMTKKDNFLGFTNNQIILGMLTYPDVWQNVKMIKVSTRELRDLIGVPSNASHVSFADLIAEDYQFKLTNYVEEANRKKPSDRSMFDKDVLNVFERANIASGIYSASLLKMFPVAGMNEVWLSPPIVRDFGSESMQIKMLSMLGNYFDGVEEGVSENRWENANLALDEIKKYQEENSSSDVYLSPTKVKYEIFLNHANLFKELTIPYIAISLAMFIIVFAYIFTNLPRLLTILRILYVATSVVVLLHLLALLLRWYIAGHAPWSNAYESMLYIAFSAGVAGVVFFRKSYLAISAATFFAGICLVVANLGFMDPQITNLVPVLKSYWLNIHVSVITASYGFLGLCFLLGIITLCLFISRVAKNNKIDSMINSITAINEMSMILGLVLLCVGNFLGGIWANESWGRYWGWDPKETWALISVGVYVIILHIRFICKKNLQYIFSSASVLGFFSILMTYFGVNYYLSGLHSYAAGDPLPIPSFLYVLVAIVVLLIVGAFFKRNMEPVKI